MSYLWPRKPIVLPLLSAALFGGCGGTPSGPTTAVSPALGDNFAGVVTEPFGVFAGVEYVRHTGVFEGESTLGAFRVPFEVVAPADPDLGENTLLFEPPHSGFGTVGRNLVLGPDLIFGRGLRFASVGVGNLSDLHILDPSIPDLLLAGAAFVPADPENLPAGSIIDEEIIALFLAALESDEDMAAMLGSIDRRYAYGISQSAAAISELLFDPTGLGQEVFDLSFLHAAHWRPVFETRGAFHNLPDGSPVPVAFDLPTGVGRVMIVNSEGDALVSDSEFYQCAIHRADFRLYEVSGAAHVPTSDAVPLGNNPL
ncbi:MAG TPA: alpha/beta hydrolase domain-containing protein, partial [Woeseiaceae bacterium]|nr:alpha/beta hydrolase domain-containing protein [Woeseiaceae bacterium]